MSSTGSRAGHGAGYTNALVLPQTRRAHTTRISVLKGLLLLSPGKSTGKASNRALCMKNVEPADCDATGQYHNSKAVSPLAYREKMGVG